MSDIMKHQKGIGLIQILVLAALLGIVGIYGFKIGKPYLEQAHLRTSVQSILKDGAAQKIPTDELKRRIWETSNVSSMNLPNDTISVDLQDGLLVADIQWKPQIPLWKGALIILDLSIKETLPVGSN